MIINRPTVKLKNPKTTSKPNTIERKSKMSCKTCKIACVFAKCSLDQICKEYNNPDIFAEGTA